MGAAGARLGLTRVKNKKLDNLPCLCILTIMYDREPIEWELDSGTPLYRIIGNLILLFILIICITWTLIKPTDKSLIGDVPSSIVCTITGVPSCPYSGTCQLNHGQVISRWYPRYGPNGLYGCWASDDPFRGMP